MAARACAARPQAAGLSLGRSYVAGRRAVIALKPLRVGLRLRQPAFRTRAAAASEEPTKEPAEPAPAEPEPEVAGAPGKGAQRGALVYGGLAVLFAAVAVAKLAAPEAAIAGLYSACGDGACIAFMRISAALMLLPAAALWALKDAAEHGRLGSATYERLNVALLVTGLGYAGLATATALSPVLVTTGFVWASVATGVVTAAAAGHVLARGEAGMGPALARIPGEAGKMMLPESNMGFFYSYICVLTFLMAGFLLAVPAKMPAQLFGMEAAAQTVGALSTALLRNVGMWLVAACTVIFTLKDAAERGRLGASTFKLLNLACCIVCAICFGVLSGYVHTAPGVEYTPMSKGLITVMAVTIGTCGYQFKEA